MPSSEGMPVVARLPAEELEPILRALANINRLRLLEALQSPRGLAELGLTPSRQDAWGSNARAISPQAVRGHLRALVDIGVVSEVPARGGGGARFVLDHTRLFAVVERLRQLASMRPSVEVAGITEGLGEGRAASDLDGPRLVLVRGVEEGRAFALGGDAGEWTIGRGAASDVRLDYDPFVSGAHARIARRGGDFVLADVATNRNGSSLNWRPLARGAVAPLVAGDVIGVGMSLLVFRS